jgi:hypothetical protein
MYGYSIGSPSDDFKGLGDGQKLATQGLNEQYHNRSLFANADYSFRQELFLKGGIRLEQSSKFGELANGLFSLSSVPVAAFPYTGITWKLKAEPWLNEINFIKELNVRTSWGVLGNQDIPVNARYSLYEDKFYTNRPGIVPSSIGDNHISWEKNQMYNAGFDLSVFKQNIGIHLDYYNVNTSNLLVPKIIDGANGTSYYWYNEGSLKNERFELALNTFGNLHNLLWRANFNIAKVKSKVNSLPMGVPIIDGKYGYTSIVAPGNQPGLLYGYKGLGVFTSDAEATASGLISSQGQPYKGGDYHFEDVNKDGIINDADKQIIGNPNPNFYGGISTGLSYKNFDLDAVFSYSYGNQVMNVLRSKLETGGGYQNQSVVVLNRWVKDGDQSSVPNTLFSDPSNNQRPSSFYVEDGSYFKMRSLTLTYNIKNKIAFIRSAQCYLSGYNLFTISNYLGWDPEVAIGSDVFTRGYDFGNYPLSKMYLIGVRIGL